MDNREYNNYADAFKAMQHYTQVNTPFKLVFKRVDGSCKLIPKAFLRKQTPSKIDPFAPYKFNYLDTETDSFGSAYIPLLLSVNNIKIKLK